MRGLWGELGEVNWNPRGLIWERGASWGGFRGGHGEGEWEDHRSLGAPWWDLGVGLGMGVARF